ncbi:MAG: diguanylate cyclase [Spirochaetaceae bacterium]|nr:diguanylate cyclase [Spirochaetaceae bacterium]
MHDFPKLVKYLPIIILLFFPGIIFAQDFNFEKLTTLDGLANNSVSGIMQDKRGFVWFSTHVGLNRYDGKDFRLFEYEPFNPNSLIDDFIKTMFYDSNKDFIWIGTKKGLSILDPVTENFLNISLNDQEAKSILDTEITAIEKDNQGNFWIGTSNGLVKINNEINDSLVFSSSKEKSFFIQDNRIKDIFCDSKDNLWISDYSGISLYKDGAFVRYFNYPGPDKENLDKNKFFCINKISEDILLIGSWGEGLILFNTVTKEYSIHNVGNNKITKIKYDNKGHIWVGTWDSGLYYFSNIESLKRNSYVKYLHDYDNEFSLSSNIVYSIFEDNSGRLWVGTDGNGVNKLNQIQKNFKHHFYIEKINEKNSEITSLLIDSTDHMWIGSTKNGVYIFDNENKEKAHFEHNPHDFSSISSNTVNSIVMDSMKNIWILTDLGVNKFNRKSNNFERYYFDGEKISKSRKNIDIQKNEFYSGKEDRDGKLWLGTSNGIYVWNVAKGITTHISKNLPKGKRLSDNTVSAIDIDTEGIIWIGTRNGLNSYHPISGNIDIYYHDYYDIHSLPDDNINTIYCDQAGNVWIGTGSGGVAVLDQKKKNFNSFTKKEELDHNTVVGLTEDQKGNIIVVTFAGISMITKKANIELSTVTSLTAQFGLTKVNLYGGIAKDKSSNIFVGSANVIYKLNTVFYYLNRENPEIVITDLTIADKSYLELFGKNIFAEEEIRLKWTNGHISFTYNAIDYSFAEGRKYKYILEGFDKYWTFPGERNYASYTAIPPGEYRFKVTGTNSSGVWSTNEASLKIIIIPPFYKTTVAYFIFALLLFAFFYGILMLVRSREVRRRLNDVSKLKDELLALNLVLEEQARIDILTGVHNRKHFNETFERLWAIYLRAKHNFSVLMIDIDYFKKFNDTYGHVAGDKAIKTVAEALLESVSRKTDSVFRYGGEEFVVLLIDTDMTGAYIVAERIRKKVLEKKIENGKIENGYGYVTVSIGVTSTNNTNPETQIQLLAMADENLYKAKESGRNTIV